METIAATNMPAGRLVRGLLPARIDERHGREGMSEASTTLHEAKDRLSEHTIDLHRALVSLREELEAVDWYRQRADACADPELGRILEHNMREEIEHASMLLEWLRRENPDFSRHLATYLDTEGPITEVEEAATKKSETPSDAPPDPLDETDTQPPAETFTVGPMKEAT
jgi:ferritin-like protein